MLTLTAYIAGSLPAVLLPYWDYRDLILGRVSHLDAFSGYLCQTWLLSNAAGATTDTLEVCPPRSSRTRGSSLQIPYAHSG
jgi:hypothetical protein